MTWTPQTPRQRAAGPNWKPERCADCGKKHPSFNKDGGRPGTSWRCGPCDKLASPLPKDDPFARSTPAPAPRPADPKQGSLL